MRQIHLEEAGSLQDEHDKHHPSLGRAEAGTNYLGAAESRCLWFLPACKLSPVLLVDRCRSAAKKVSGSDPSGLRAGLALALQYCTCPPHQLSVGSVHCGYWNCDSVAISAQWLLFWSHWSCQSYFSCVESWWGASIICSFKEYLLLYFSKWISLCFSSTWFLLGF